MSRAGAEGPRKLRLFFALWPLDSLRSVLAAMASRVAEGVEGQPVPPGNLHVTLAFLGMVAGTELASLIEVGGSRSWPEVPIVFDRVEFWSRPRVLVAAPVAIPPEGRQIVDHLWIRLEPLGHEREARPWQPHLTLVRRIRRPPTRNLAAAGAVEADGRDWRLALVESTTHPEGPRYKPLADWPLGQVFSRGRSP